MYFRFLFRLHQNRICPYVQPYFKPRCIMSGSVEKRAADHLFGIDIDWEPLYFATSEVKDKLNLEENYSDLQFTSELANDVLYSMCKTDPPEGDIVKRRMDHRTLEKSLKTIPSYSSIWSSFLLHVATDREDFSYYNSGFTLKFEKDRTARVDHTENVLNAAKTFGFSTILKLVPSKQGRFLVDVISCETSERISRFVWLSVKYSGHHPSFDYGHSVFKSFPDTREVLDLANKYFPGPEVNTLIHLADGYTKKPLAGLPGNGYPHPFIVIEGLDGVGKTTLVHNLSKRLAAEVFHTPPSCMSRYREFFVKQCQPICRAFYSLGNYLIAEEIKAALVKHPVILDRFWHSSAAYAIAKEAKCGDESNIPAKGHAIYQWPVDLLKPSAVIFLVLSEKERRKRMRIRGDVETNEEAILRRNHLLRERLIATYKNMENPACIIVDASKSKEEVCDDVLMTLKHHEIW